MTSAAPERPQKRLRRWQTALAIAVGKVLVRLLASTWSIRVRNDDAFRAFRAAGRPVMFILWHGQMVPCLWQHRRQKVAILISEHRDGEIIARIAHSLGYRTIRGSTSRGGARALLELSNVLAEGTDVAVTPDGPRGPAGSFAPGALVAAQRGGGGVLCIAAHASKAWRLRSWDRFMIPKPFATVTIAYRGPLMLPEGSAREAAERAGEFAAMLHATAEDASA